MPVIRWALRQISWVSGRSAGQWMAFVAIVILVPLACWFIYRVHVLEFSTDTALGWYGVVLGIIGFGYTAVQLYLTKRESIAAKVAADDAKREVTAHAEATAYSRLIDWALYFLDDVNTAADGRGWKIAVRRLRDTARQLREIQIARDHSNDRWNQYADNLDHWADQLKEFSDARKAPDDFPDEQWRQSLSQVRNELFAQRGG